MMRKIANIIKAQPTMMGEILLHQPLPTQKIEQISPFILLHHLGPYEFGPDNMALDIGPHPHRGFEPVTFVFSGEINHHDSRGNKSIISSGGVQWMTSGMGIIHAEYASKRFRKTGGKLEAIQLWINLPAKLKMIQPNYQGFQKEDIPYKELNNERGQVNIISGSWNGLVGPIESITNIKAFTLELKKGAEVQFEFAPTENVLFYLLKGNVDVNESQWITDRTMLEFERADGFIAIKTREDSLILLVSGEPINEPIAQYGPFVMNNQTELMQAIKDYQMGKMGVLVNED
ncbi:MAG TPA: pirin family protein [Chitinophagaceae bacterium]|nr:pirin family protein [Chitinophagaceae bacterium]